MVLPYARWLALVINLGYTGYALYSFYLKYREQTERDQREGRETSLEETMRRIINEESRETENQENCADTTVINAPSPPALPRAINTDPEGQDEDEVTITYDSRTDRPVMGENGRDNDETQSTTSSSVWSSDSNQGVVHDLYSNCFICASSLNDSGKPVATLPFCMHPFHESCLNGVLKWHPKCPVCDFHIFSPI